MGQIGDVVGSMIPNFSMAGAGKWIIIILGGLLFATLLAVGAYFLFTYLKFDKKIKIFRRVGNQIVLTATDVGMFARVGAAGDYWLKLKKFKKTLPRPQIQMAKNEFWYYERDDGEWINFSLADLDEQMKKASAYYVDEDMRLQRLGIQKNLGDRFQKLTFWQKYGTTVITLVYLMVITVCVVIMFQKMAGGWAAVEEASKAIHDMAIATANVATRTGGGLVPA